MRRKAICKVPCHIKPHYFATLYAILEWERLTGIGDRKVRH